MWNSSHLFCFHCCHWSCDHPLTTITILTMHCQMSRRHYTLANSAQDEIMQSSEKLQNVPFQEHFQGPGQFSGVIFVCRNFPLQEPDLNPPWACSCQGGRASWIEHLPKRELCRETVLNIPTDWSFPAFCFSHQFIFLCSAFFLPTSNDKTLFLCIQITLKPPFCWILQREMCAYLSQRWSAAYLFCCLHS